MSEGVTEKGQRAYLTIVPKGRKSPLMKLPYSIGMAGGHIFDVLSRLTGKKFPISSIRIKKFCASTTVSTHALGAINFKAPFALLEGLKRLIRSMN